MSRTTHGAPEPVDACRYYAGLILGALHGAPKEMLLAPRYSPAPCTWEPGVLSPRIDTIAAGSFKSRQPPQIRGTGYVVDALEAALWAFWTTADFKSGALAAVNLGDDADTTGAIYGQLAGAYYGLEGIPEPWLERVALRDGISRLAEGLLDLARPTGG
jgi:ADP-ribosylglycohydrolase